ncbi:hypothetical protein ACH5RR_035513 [Cinchona calisaya]|uniref:Uncharacterized protein n=1 Tax=Cinchona calisaya TaxID=153742 RepID=A0ABD2Y5I4_9GENT
MFRTAAKTSLAYASHLRRLSTGALVEVLTNNSLRSSRVLVATKWFGKQTDRNLLEEILHIVKDKLEMDERKRKIDEMVYGLMNLMGHVMIEKITTKLETKAEVLKKMEELVKELEIQEDDPPEVYQWKNRILAQLWKIEVIVSRM